MSHMRLILLILFLITSLATPANASEPAPCSINEESSVGEEIEYKPCPQFTYSPKSPTAADTVQFDATSSYQPADGSLNEYFWYFGESGGADETGVTTQTSFNEPGNHTVGLTVVNNRGQRTYYERTIQVVNTPPTAEFSYSPEPMIEQEIEFDASDSTDIEGSITEYRWDLGDGTTATGIRTIHEYDEYGEYDVVLTVSDGEYIDNISRTVVVDNVPPVPEINFKQIPDELTVDDEIAVNATGSHDPDGDGIESFLWRFGDGNRKQGYVANHSYSAPGMYNITLEVDDGMDSAQKAEEIRVINRPPVANLTYSPQEDLTVGGNITFDASGSRDPDNNIKELHWEFGNGETAQGEVVEHSYEELGTYEVTLTVDDGRSTDEETTTVTVGPGGESANGFGVFIALLSVLMTSVLIGRFSYYSD